MVTVESEARDDYPLPSNAVSVWITAEALMVGVPSSVPGGKGHTLAIPIDKCTFDRSEFGSPVTRQAGWAHLLQLLKAQRAASAAKARTLGTPAALSQWQLENALREATKYDSKGREVVVVGLEDLGL